MGLNITLAFHGLLQMESKPIPKEVRDINNATYNEMANEVIMGFRGWGERGRLECPKYMHVHAHTYLPRTHT